MLPSTASGCHDLNILAMNRITEIKRYQQPTNRHRPVSKDQSDEHLRVPRAHVSSSPFQNSSIWRKRHLYTQGAASWSDDTSGSFSSAGSRFLIFVGSLGIHSSQYPSCVSWSIRILSCIVSSPHQSQVDAYSHTLSIFRPSMVLHESQSPLGLHARQCVSLLQSSPSLVVLNQDKDLALTIRPPFA